MCILRDTRLVVMAIPLMKQVDKMMIANKVVAMTAQHSITQASRGRSTTTNTRIKKSDIE